MRLLFQESYQIVDEIWASIKFTTRAFKADARVKVELMPMHVDVSPGAGLSRKAFDLPTEPFCSYLLLMWVLRCNVKIQ